jgi:hypothetical protein
MYIKNIFIVTVLAVLASCLHGSKSGENELNKKLSNEKTDYYYFANVSTCPFLTDKNYQGRKNATSNSTNRTFEA